MKLVKYKELKIGYFYLEYWDRNQRGKSKYIILGKFNGYARMVVISNSFNGTTVESWFGLEWNLYVTSDFLYELDEEEITNHILLETI